jgi:hypothetical protein
MQTFLPYVDFVKSAECLDSKRLGKQRVEVLQLLRALHGETRGWINHPATRMWRGYENYLVEYGNDICSEWVHRGYKDSCRDKILKYYISGRRFGAPMPYPTWLGNEAFHASHRSNLLRKDPVHYGKFGWTEPDNFPYVWPV